MFNLIVSRTEGIWEQDRCVFDARRFLRNSAESNRWVRPHTLEERHVWNETLRIVEQLPTLLAYETTARSEHRHDVRHGVISDLALNGHELSFVFMADPLRPVIPRTNLVRRLGEFALRDRDLAWTHWLVVEHDLPDDLFDAVAKRSIARRSQANARVAYRVAARRPETRAGPAPGPATETDTDPVKRGRAYLREEMQHSACLHAHALLGLKPRTQEARAAIRDSESNDLLIVDPYPDSGLGSTPFLLAPFFDVFGTPTESARLAEALEECHAAVSELDSAYRSRGTGLRSIAYVLWQCGRHPVLAEPLRRPLGRLIARLLSDRNSDLAWNSENHGSDLFATVMIAVGVQRLGDDQHRTAVCETVQSLCRKRLDDGSLAALCTEDSGDTLATVLLLESVRRSLYADDLAHVIAEGECWLRSDQEASGAWHADGWPPPSVTAIVLDYLEHKDSMLPQVDGFFMMARDFFTRAIELRIEGGVNSRRLGAIAAVHALEMFLYGVFERRPDLGVTAYRDKGDETLGPRSALAALQGALRENGNLEPRQSLSHRDRLSALIRARDNVIHHASEISDQELARGVEAVGRFISLYGVMLAETDLLQ